MAYSDFTLGKFKKSFSIHINEETDLCANAEPLQPSEKLTNSLEETNYYIKEIDKILGILSQSVHGDIPGWSSTN